MTNQPITYSTKPANVKGKLSYEVIETYVITCFPVSAREPEPIKYLPGAPFIGHGLNAEPQSASARRGRHACDSSQGNSWWSNNSAMATIIILVLSLAILGTAFGVINVE